VRCRNILRKKGTPSVVVWASRQTRTELVAELQGRSRGHFVRTDVRRMRTCAPCGSNSRRSERLDIAVNNAGRRIAGLVTDSEPQRLCDTFDRTYCVLLSMKHEMRAMCHRGAGHRQRLVRLWKRRVLPEHPFMLLANMR